MSEFSENRKNGISLNNVKPIEYHQGIFDYYKESDKLEHWESFPNLMWGLGYEMDCGESFERFIDGCGLELSIPTTGREKRKNELFLLEHADRQVVGNYLFSHWRYLTHWSYGYDEYDVDFIKRIIKILEEKYAGNENM